MEMTHAKRAEYRRSIVADLTNLGINLTVKEVEKESLQSLYLVKKLVKRLKKERQEPANVIKFTSLLALRDQGWGKTRLTRFSEKFDEILIDVNINRLTFSDITTRFEKETRLDSKEFLIKNR